MNYRLGKPSGFLLHSRRLTYDTDWEAIEGKVMSQLTLSKYDENPLSKKKLLATKASYLEDRNAHEERAWRTDKSGKGNNKTGKIILAVRTVLSH